VNILVVEDHEETLKTLASLLSRYGHPTMTARTRNGSGGVSRLHPHIALTALDSDVDHKLGFEAGFDHYLTKPFDFGELRRLLG
jgi:DNA-binding response OmpR family regulator